MKNAVILFLVLCLLPLAHAQVVSPTSFNVPLTVVGPTISIIDDPISYDGSNTYVSSGIPFPKNTAITDATKCQVRLNGSPVPAQFSVISRRGGLMTDATKPIQWLLTTFLVQSLPAGGTNTSYALHCDNSNAPGPAPATPVSIVSNTTNSVVVNTGPAVFDVSKTTGKIFNSATVNGTSMLSPNNTGLVMRAQDDADGSNTYPFIVNPNGVTVVENGPLRAVVQINGYYDNSSTPGITPNFGNTKPMNAVVRLTFYANSSNVEMRHVLTNNGAIGRPFPNASVPPEDKAVFRELEVILNPALSGTQTARFGSNAPVTASGNELILAQRGAPTKYDKRYHNALHQAPNDATVTNIIDNFFTQFANGNTVTTQANTHFDDAVILGDTTKGIAMGMRGFWQTFPKDYRVNQNKIAVSLYPGNRTGQPQFEYTYVPYFRTNITTPTHCCVSDPNWASTAELLDLVHPETLDITNPEFHYNANSNNVMPGGTRDYQDLLIQFYPASTSFAEIQRRFDAFNHPPVAVPTDTEYTSATEATPMLMPPKRDWANASTIPASFRPLFARADKLFQIQVDSTALASSVWQTNSIFTCTDLLQKQGATFGGWPSWGNTIAGDDMDGGWGRENNHYVASGGWNLMQFLRDFDYRQFEYGQLRAYHNNTFGTAWGSAYPSTYGLARYESGFNSLALTNGAHYWPHGLWMSYLLTGSPEMLDGTPQYADYLSANVPMVGGVFKYINGGGGRIAGRSISAIAMAYKVLGKPNYYTAINNWMIALINGEQHSISIGCPPGSFPNSISPASQPCNVGWSESTLTEGAEEGYYLAGLNNPTYVALFQRMIEFFRTHLLLGGTGSPTSYYPYEMASHWDSAFGYNIPGFYTSRIDPIDLADPIMMYNKITQTPQNPLGDPQFVGLAQQLFKEGLLWNLGSGAIDTTNPAQVNPLTCRSTQYPSSYHNKILGKWEDSISTAAFFFVNYFDAGGTVLPPPAQPPSVTLNANGAGGSTWVPTGTTTIGLSWLVSNATSCTASASPSTAAWTGSIAPANGSLASIPITASPSYFTLNCTGVGGASSSTVTVNIGTPPSSGGGLPIPNAPANFVVTALGPTDVLLTWDDVDNETNYKIVRHTPSTASGQLLTDTIPANSTSYTDTAAAPGTTIQYDLRAYSNVSPYYNSPYAYATVITPPSSGGVPSAPTGLTAAGTSPTSVNLSWTDVANNETGYHVQRRTCVSSTVCTSSFVTITANALAANSNSYADTSATSDNIYEYRVFAVNGSNTSPYSNVALATTGKPSSSTYLPVNNASFSSSATVPFSALIHSFIPQSVTVELRVRDLSQPNEQVVNTQIIPATPSGTAYAHTYSPPAAGNYSWRVIVSTPVGTQNSNLLYFSVNGPAPTPNPPALGVISPTTIPVIWQRAIFFSRREIISRLLRRFWWTGWRCLRVRSRSSMPLRCHST
ncbi:MAG: fibronectin type III domain-containing protein [Candidatus Iainarchaeum archaeon]|uniref:Fibronectin type III domain-containing protein n=1 Tax=Candidatus Iainarchaeum sp. TaxID=3101447 RepID=A0A7T9DJ39_9ARCH|nr:MAG: fibronectin type III domain-containing protein [Candidatus Diapherotrites archaeon]